MDLNTRWCRCQTWSFNSESCYPNYLGISWDQPWAQYPTGKWTATVAGKCLTHDPPNGLFFSFSSDQRNGFTFLLLVTSVSFSVNDLNNCSLYFIEWLWGWEIGVRGKYKWVPKLAILCLQVMLSGVLKQPWLPWGPSCYSSTLMPGRISLYCFCFGVILCFH